MQQEKYNKWALIISIFALFLSIAFPYFKEQVLDSPKIYITNDNFLKLNQWFGNPSIGLDINLTNNGQKTALISKIEISLFNADNEPIIKKKVALIFDPIAEIYDNIIVSKFNSSNTFSLILPLNDIDDEEKNEKIIEKNNVAISYFNNKGYTINNFLGGQNVQLSDSLFDDLRDFCVTNLKSLKKGDYKIIYYVYEVGDAEPKIVFGKSFKISTPNITSIYLSLENYKWGAQIFTPSKFLYSQFSYLRAYNLNNEEINTLRHLK